jgi:hypothetical protein
LHLSYLLSSGIGYDKRYTRDASFQYFSYIIPFVGKPTLAF